MVGTPEKCGLGAAGVDAETLLHPRLRTVAVRALRYPVCRSACCRLLQPLSAWDVLDRLRSAATGGSGLVRLGRLISTAGLDPCWIIDSMMAGISAMSAL